MLPKWQRHNASKFKLRINKRTLDQTLARSQGDTHRGENKASVKGERCVGMRWGDSSGNQKLGSTHEQRYVFFSHGRGIQYFISELYTFEAC